MELARISGLCAIFPCFRERNPPQYFKSIFELPCNMYVSVCTYKRTMHLIDICLWTRFKVWPAG